MEEFKQEFTEVKGISAKRRLPRLGKIRLGIKVLNAPDKINKEKCKCQEPGNPGCPYCTHPKEVTYFVVPPEVEKIYGPKPTKLDIMFPLNDRGSVFPQAYKYYGYSIGLKCIGDGVKARQAQEDGTFKEIVCPCKFLDSKRCSLRAHLLFILPKVNLGGIYQLDVGSYHSIVDVNSGIDYCRGIIESSLHIDRFAMIPLTLSREEKITHFEGRRQKHWTLQLNPNLTLEDLRELEKDTRILSPPDVQLAPIEDKSPGYDGSVVVSEEEKTAEKEPELAQEEEPLSEPETKKKSPAKILKEEEKNRTEDFKKKKEMVEEFSKEYTKHLHILQDMAQHKEIPATEYGKIVTDCTKFDEEDFPKKIQYLIEKIAEIKAREENAGNKQDNKG